MRETTKYSYNVEVIKGYIICEDCLLISKPSKMFNDVCQPCADAGMANGRELN